MLENMWKILKQEKIFSWYADDHLHVADQRFEVSSLTQRKRIETLKPEEQKEKLLQKLSRPFAQCL